MYKPCDSVLKLRVEMDALMRERGIRCLPGFDDLPFFTGYESGRLFGWDQYFEGLLQWHAGWDTSLLRHSLFLFLRHIRRDGYIPRTLPDVWWGRFHAQPFLAQQALLLLRAGDPLEGFHPEYYFALKHYLLHWLRQCDARGAGLAVWDHAGHSGMDNHTERGGTFFDAYCEGVDLNAYLLRECRALAQVAGHFGETADAEAFDRRAEGLRKALLRWCWDDVKGFFFDYHARENRLIRVRHVGVVAALWAGVPSAEQAGRMVREHLSNPAEFARPWPLPALAANEPGYVEGWVPGEAQDCCSWRAHTWLPSNYMAFHGLLAYGFREEAVALAQRTRELFVRHPFREYYASETGAPWGRDPFWGWSGLALYMEAEAESDQDPTALTLEPLG